MGRFRRLAGFLAAAAAAIAGGMTFEEWLDGRTVVVANQTKSDLVALCEADDSACVLVEKLLPSETLPAAQCCEMAGGNLCRYGLEYGPGMGGRPGCSCVGQSRYPCTAGSAGESESVLESIRANNGEEIAAWIEKIAKRHAERSGQ